MRLTKTSAYGILIVRHIAAHEKKGATHVSDLVPVCGIPDTFLSKICVRLTRSRVLKGERGRDGGYSLTKPAAKTTLQEIIEALEGPMAGEISIDRKATVPAKARKKLESVCKDLATYQRKKLKGITVKQLMG